MSRSSSNRISSPSRLATAATSSPAAAPAARARVELVERAARLDQSAVAIDQAMDRMLNGVLSVLRPYGEARAVDDAAARQLEALSALRRQSLDRLSRIEMRRAGIEAGGDSPPMAAALPPVQPPQPTVTPVPGLGQLALSALAALLGGVALRRRRNTGA